ncbi:hypothetical protein [Pseudonocardia autotrophica]|uniref:hypothetical protein n=1 Tax=Pseudonocardia autotrophica TaxID=2074 RepID=UPI0013022CCE|nr:hypothetical protein [Pseudonocardia autotrophica]
MPITSPDQIRQPRRETPRPRIPTHHHPLPRQQPPQQPPPTHPGQEPHRDRPEPPDLRRKRTVLVEQRLHRNHHLHLDIDMLGTHPPGHPLHQRVGHDLPTSTGQRLRRDLDPVERLAQRRETGHPLLDGQMRPQINHPVGRLPQRHPPPRPRHPATLPELPRRHLRDQRTHQIPQPGHPEPGDVVLTQPPIDLRPLPRVEMRRRRDHDRHPIPVDLPRREQPTHTTQTVVQIPGRTHPMTTHRRRSPIRQPDLRADTALETLRIEQSRIEQSRIEQSRIEQSRIEQSRIEQSRIEQSRIATGLRGMPAGERQLGRRQRSIHTVAQRDQRSHPIHQHRRRRHLVDHHREPLEPRPHRIHIREPGNARLLIEGNTGDRGHMSIIDEHMFEHQTLANTPGVPRSRTVTPRRGSPGDTWR